MPHLTDLLGRADSIAQTNARLNTPLSPCSSTTSVCTSTSTLGSRANSRARDTSTSSLRATRRARSSKPWQPAPRDTPRPVPRNCRHRSTDFAAAAQAAARAATPSSARWCPRIRASVVDVELAVLRTARDHHRMRTDRSRRAANPARNRVRSADPLRRASRPRSESPFRRRTCAPGCAHAPSAPYR